MLFGIHAGLAGTQLFHYQSLRSLTLLSSSRAPQSSGFMLVVQIRCTSTYYCWVLIIHYPSLS
jgi:hypothetical protein